MADQDYGNCDCCGNPLTEDDVYRNVLDQVGEALDILDDDYDRMSVIAFYAGRLISDFFPNHQKSARRQLARWITEETRAWNIAGCDA